MPPTAPTRKKPPTARQTARRIQLLDAASHTFATHGYHGATMAAVSNAADVAKPVLYQHFSTKLELYLAVVQRSLDDLVASVKLVLASAETEYDSVHGTITVIFDLIDHGESDHSGLLLPTLPDESSVDRRTRTALIECATAVSDQLRPHDPEPRRARLLAFALLGAAISAARHWRQAGRPVSKLHAIDTITTWYRSGLRATNDPLVDTADCLTVPGSQSASGRPTCHQLLSHQGEICLD
ncbi:TetR/AcrR family transcriptional regulator [Nocardia asteroides]|uniref:TetR/AcrR family transcriptional regulator n=1 Tax=Nocardia asteroides TaxID=1824 RepID=UPI003436B4BC